MLVGDKQKTKEVLIEKGLEKYVIKGYKESPKGNEFPVILKDNSGRGGKYIYIPMQKFR